MKLYEGMFLLDSNLATKDWSGLETHILEILKKNKAELLYSEKWPERRLAFDVKGCKKGTYYLTYFNAPHDVIGDIERDSKLSERILRLLIVTDEGLPREMERRKNREVTAPPTELSFEDDRFEGRGDFGGGFGRRREAPRGPEAAPVQAPVPAAEEVSAPGGEEEVSQEKSS